ncbi:MAG TPA: hypothetical protein VF796_05960 [Humisphaera sp.]
MSSDDRNGTQSGIGGPAGGASANGDGHGPEDETRRTAADPVSASTDAGPAGGAADAPAPFAVDDPDEPTNPDEATRANVEAARAALRRRSGGFRPPRGRMGTIALVVIILCTMTMLGYGIWFFMGIKNESEVARLKHLELQDYVSVRQQEYTRLTGLVAAGQIHPVLTPAQRAQLAELKQAYGSQFNPATDAEAIEIDGLLALARSATRSAAATQPASPEADKAELYRLEQQAYLAGRGAEFRKLTGRLPREIYVPPVGPEAARMAALRATYGPQYKPAEDEEAADIERQIREARAAATQPATAPAQ